MQLPIRTQKGHPDNHGRHGGDVEGQHPDRVGVEASQGQPPDALPLTGRQTRPCEDTEPLPRHVDGRLWPIRLNQLIYADASRFRAGPVVDVAWYRQWRAAIAEDRHLRDESLKPDC
jgi:hypothetical protein